MFYDIVVGKHFHAAYILAVFKVEHSVLYAIIVGKYSHAVTYGSESLNFLNRFMSRSEVSASFSILAHARL